MKKKILFGLLILTLIAVPLFAVACEEEEVTPPAQQEEEEQPPAEEEEEEGDWWDKFGEPQYGDSITYRVGSIAPTWDNAIFPGADYQLYFECLWTRDWALDRDICDFQGFIPNEYHVGTLAESWEWTDPQTITVHIREGVTWQDKPPVNGREFTAYDVQEHYDRVLGTGSGYTEPNPQFMSFTAAWDKVTATDDYTAVIELKYPSALAFANFLFPVPLNRIEAPEWVAQGDLQNWENAVGTGPWMLEDYVSGASITYSANPDYWGHDARHPENQLPYVDELKVLIVPDVATAMAGLRTGQIDLIGGNQSMLLSWEQAESLKSTNPELVIEASPQQTYALKFRLDTEPFTDIRVRKALQLAINREEIAADYYHGGADAEPAGIFDPKMEGYAYAYEDWPQELKDEYAYNVEGAKALLAEAAADGVFTPNAEGGFDFNVITSDNTDPVLLQVFQSYLKEIGVNIDIELMDQGGFLANACSGNFDYATWWGGAKAELWAYSDYLPGAAMNFIQANDSVYNDLASKVEHAADTTELGQWTTEIDKYFLYQHWLIPACSPYGYSAWQPYLKGYSNERLNSTLDHILSGCWIDQALKESMGR